MVCGVQVIRTRVPDWGIRAVHAIPEGSFVMECIGQLLDSTEAENRREQR